MRAWLSRWPHWPLQRPPGSADPSALFGSVAAVAAVIAYGGLLVFATVATESWRLTAILFGATALPVLAQATGNPRLFCVWCLMFVLPFELSLYLGPFSDKGGGERAFRIELADVFFVSLLAFQLRDLLSGRWPGLRVPKVILVWLGIMVFWGGYTLLEGRFRTTAVHEMVRMLKMTVLFVVIVNELDTPRRMLHACAAITFGMLFQASFGLMQYLNGRPLGLDVLGELSAKTSELLATQSVRDTQVFRISGFVGHPNLFGIYLAACLPLAVGGLLLGRGHGLRLFFAVSSLAGGVALILTQSRSGWAAGAAALLLLLALMLMHRRLFARSLSTIAAGTVVMALLFGAFQEPILKRLFESQDSAATGREEFKEDARRLIDVKPWFGWGLNQYVLELPPYMKYHPRAYGGWIPPVHNIYYLWWAETGLIGLMVHLAFWAAILVAAGRNLRVHDETLFIMNLACMAALIAFAVDGFLSFTLRVNPPQRLYFVLAGMIYATRAWRLEQQRLPWPARRGDGDSGGAQ